MRWSDTNGCDRGGTGQGTRQNRGQRERRKEKGIQVNELTVLKLVTAVNAVLHPGLVATHTRYAYKIVEVYSMSPHKPASGR